MFFCLWWNYCFIDKIVIETKIPPSDRWNCRCRSLPCTYFGCTIGFPATGTKPRWRHKNGTAFLQNLRFSSYSTTNHPFYFSKQKWMQPRAYQMMLTEKMSATRIPSWHITQLLNTRSTLDKTGEDYFNLGTLSRGITAKVSYKSASYCFMLQQHKFSTTKENLSWACLLQSWKIYLVFIHAQSRNHIPPTAGEKTGLCWDILKLFLAMDCKSWWWKSEYAKARIQFWKVNMANQNVYVHDKEHVQA